MANRMMELKSMCYIPTNIFPKMHLYNWPEDTYVVPEYAFGFECTEEIKLSHEHTECMWLSYQDVYEKLRWDSNRTALYEPNCRLRKDNVLTLTNQEKEAANMTDEQYYRLYLDGDETGLSELMKKYGSALTLYINGYLHDLHEAEDLMIEVFTYLFVKKPRIRDGGLKAYLYKSARHMAIRHRKKLHLSFSMENLSEEPESVCWWKRL